MTDWVMKRKGLFIYLSGVVGYFLLMALLRRVDVIFLPTIRYQNLISIILLVVTFIVSAFYWIKDAKMIPDILLMSPVILVVIPMVVLGMGPNVLESWLYILLSLLIIFSQISYFKSRLKLWMALMLPLILMTMVLSLSNLNYLSIILIYALLAFIKLYSQDAKLQRIIASVGLVMPFLFVSLITMFTADQWIKDDTELDYITVEEVLVMVEQYGAFISETIELSTYESIGFGFYRQLAFNFKEGYTLPSLDIHNLDISINNENDREITLIEEDLKVTIQP